MNNVEVVCPLISNQLSAGSSRDKTVDRDSVDRVARREQRVESGV